MQRQYELGVKLRQRYNDFLGNIFTWKSVETFSTDFDRTKMSALLTLAGLYPPGPTQKWNANVPWLPIAYKALPPKYDHVRIICLRTHVLQCKQIKSIVFIQ